jgi:hypothetical protein
MRGRRGHAGGAGLWIVRKVADEVTVSSGPHGSLVSAIFLR